MSYEAQKKALSENILELGRRVGLNSMNAILREARLEWKPIGVLSKGKGNPTIESLYKLAEALDCSIDDLFKKPKIQTPTANDIKLAGRRLSN